ncbi:MAG: L,D-transpeptidase family protein [Chloroflexi bacterium]|nr:L,D-transpeptidase family protein [Chloroflexota bacterium]
MLPSLSPESRRRASTRYSWLPLLLGLLLFFGWASQSLAQSSGSDGPPALQTLDTPEWAVAVQAAALHSQPDEGSEQFTTVRPLAPLQILGYAGDWAYVLNPRTKGTAYVKSDLLGPGGPPSSYAQADPPPVDEEMDRTGRVDENTALSFYPTSDPSAAYTQLDAGTSVEITGSLTSDDGAQWYRTADGDYLPASAVAFSNPSAPSAPGPAVASAPSRTFAGHWIDVSLTLPARMTAYNGNTAVRTMYTIIGRGPLATPAGNFSIIRRVANETMDSSTVGIPRNSAGGYYLTNVLWTQYFLPGGQSIHYNYWSSNWGYPGSHGCLGLSYSDASFMWDFATIGTPVSIHY